MKLLFPFLLALLTAPVYGAAISRQLRENIKKNQKLEETAKELLAEAQNTNTDQDTRIECYRLAAECSKKLNAIENEKLYLGQKYDTARFFSSVLDMYQRIFIADSISALPDAYGRSKPSNRKSSRSMLLPYRPYLQTAGRWYFSKKKYADAFRYLDQYIQASKHPIFDKDKFFSADTLILSSAYLAVVSAHEANLPQGVIRYGELAKRAGLKSHLIHEYVTQAWKSMGEEKQWEKSLWQGVVEYPSYTYFFTHLIDHLTETDQLTAGMAVADSLCKAEPDMAIAWYAKALIQMRLHHNEAAIEACDECIRRDSTFADAYYTKGLASLNLAVIETEQAPTDLTDPAYAAGQQRIRARYEQARKPMEHFRAQRPDDKERWAAPLYRIYLHLNMGEEFEEMDKLLNK